jgi:hypothetical protein
MDKASPEESGSAKATAGVRPAADMMAGGRFRIVT